ncbi:phosphate-selective porin [Pedobacter glucosidilyticus]|nr:porin [Pedobacter glucosidilyticus]KHJ37383.1 phosphate-selective porin [Pedobacter glucosidilyticus]
MYLKPVNVLSSFLLFAILTFTHLSQAQTKDTLVLKSKASIEKWYDKLAIRGYAQLRYNGLIESNPNLKCEQCDRSWGDGGDFFIRRIRLIFFGQISEKVYLYIQPDFASATGNSLNFGQIRDAYVDVGLDKDNEFRFRFGQSKIPYGFENMQSSQNRLTLDRNDAINSAAANERDLGLFFYWAPKEIRQRFSDLVKLGLKGSGDYGVFGFGAYNGQTANRPDLNNKQHLIARLSYPFLFGKQFIEPGIQAYTGKYVMAADQLSSGVKTNASKNYLDQRIAATLVVYPQPFGVQAEYNIGKGPEFNKQTDSIEVKSLNGGYVMFNYMAKINNQLLYPFVKAQYYDGGKKHERDARSYLVKELEIGAEWEPNKFLELVVNYTFSSRRFEDFALQDNLQRGSLLRIQAQINF